MLKRDEVIAKIQAHREEICALGAASLYLYGSVARDEATDESDIDVFVDKQPGHKFSFREYTGIIHLLEDAFGRSVDVGTRESLHPALRSDIVASAIRVF
jgi:uncharacterized protein